jgi:uncharacterized protein
VLIVVSPAKSLDYESPLPTKKFTEPELLDRSEELIQIMRTKSVEEIGSLMSISAGLAQLNHDRYHDFERPFTSKNARQALLAFDGDVYDGMQARTTFSTADFTHAQKVFRMLSGLYGVLRPLDLMMPYRLEMGTKLSNQSGKDLYAYWGNTITEKLNEALSESPGAHLLVNLASIEYFTAVRTSKLDAPVIAPTFLDADPKTGNHRIVSFFAKKARGSMAAWIIRERITSPKALLQFEGMGYQYDKARSTSNAPAFVRSATAATSA